MMNSAESRDGAPNREYRDPRTVMRDSTNHGAQTGTNTPPGVEWLGRPERGKKGEEYKA